MTPPKNKNYLDIFFLGIVLVLTILLYLKFGNENNSGLNETLRENPAPLLEQSDLEPNQDSTQIEDKTTFLPAELLIDVPFTSQAPLSVWDELHEDACEEASLLMLWHWKNKTAFSNTQVDQEIVRMVGYESERGYGKSITLLELSEIASGHSKFSGIEVVPIQGVTDIKRAIAEGSPVIVGAAGKILPNPNFRNGGPYYHMLLIKGYDENGFITNDPGTRKGESYYYTNEELWNAIHDWNSADIQAGEKNMLYFAQ